MAYEPEDGNRKGNDENDEHNPAFTTFFAKGYAPATVAAAVAVALILQRDGNIEPAASLACAHKKFFALAP